MLIARQTTIPTLAHQLMQGLGPHGPGYIHSNGYIHGYVFELAGPHGVRAEVLTRDNNGADARQAILKNEILRLESSLGLQIVYLRVNTESDRWPLNLADGQANVYVSNYLEIIEIILGLELIETGRPEARFEAAASTTHSTRTAMLQGEGARQVQKLTRLASKHGVPHGLHDELFAQWISAMGRLLGVSRVTEFKVALRLTRPSAHQRLHWRHLLDGADWASFEKMIRTGRAG